MGFQSVRTQPSEQLKQKAAQAYQRIRNSKRATAMEEMSATIEEVSRNTSDTSDKASHAAEQAEAGRQIILETAQAMEALAEEINTADGTVQQLREQALSINNIVDVITGIAEQTNLLPKSSPVRQLI